MVAFVGGPCPVHGGIDRDYYIFRMVSLKGAIPVKESLIPFLAAFVASAVLFVALDFVMMNLQGLSLLFHQ